MNLYNNLPILLECSHEIVDENSIEDILTAINLWSTTQQEKEGIVVKIAESEEGTEFNYESNIADAAEVTTALKYTQRSCEATLTAGILQLYFNIQKDKVDEIKFFNTYKVICNNDPRMIYDSTPEEELNCRKEISADNANFKANKGGNDYIVAQSWDPISEFRFKIMRNQ